jgi:hypothetical protein
LFTAYSRFFVTAARYGTAVKRKRIFPNFHVSFENLCFCLVWRVVHLANGHRPHVNPKPEKHAVENDKVASNIRRQKTKLPQNFFPNFLIGKSSVLCTKDLRKVGIAGPDAFTVRRYRSARFRISSIRRMPETYAAVSALLELLAAFLW